jgi:hypothetical protein
MGEVVDLAPDTKITLNFKSNAFGDISKITASNSLTINLPKTPTNERIFGVAGQTKAAFNKWQAELYVNGVRVVDVAYLQLLSVGKTYETALYWGVVTALEALKASDKSIADIGEVLTTQYGGDAWWDGWAGKFGKDETGNDNYNLINAAYNPGIDNFMSDSTARAQAALHPSVTCQWVWDNIVAENALDIERNGHLTEMSWWALPFTAHNAPPADAYRVDFLHFDWEKERHNGVTYSAASARDISNPPQSGFYEWVTTEVPIYPFERKKDMVATILRSKGVGKVRYAFSASVTGSKHGRGDKIVVEHRSASHNTVSKAISGIGKDAVLDVELQNGDYIVAYVNWHKSSNQEDLHIVSLWANIITDYGDSVEKQAMGGIIRTRENLPSIKQIDFVKAMCALDGVWATLIDGKIHLVSHDDFYKSTTATLDWSHKLIGTGDGDAENNIYTLGDYAQRNWLKYKTDASVEVDASGALIVENATLDAQKDMYTLPFAASDDKDGQAVIRHLKWKGDNSASGEIEDVKVEPRVVGLSQHLGADGKQYASLGFEDFGMSFAYLANNAYKGWQRIMRRPLVIEERMHLTEIDIATLDYRKPIYLQKYGARFIVDKVQWSEEESKVTLVKLPPATDISVYEAEIE